jgi:UDP-4-amino-4-deoxy-L-arabinose formyltransferase/UDP-glucuronic acid dehydrogenase (UDP-4-keto-hexauronic acid decarboxylating)
MRLALIGRTEALYRAGRALAAAGHEIALVATALEAPEYARTSTDFAALADDLGAEFAHEPRLSGAAGLSLLRRCAPLDLGVSMNYVSVLSQAAIDCFRLGILNAHGGDLPRYRGNACQAWAILNGEKRLGLCIHKMVGGELDTGDIIARDYMPLDGSTRVGDCWTWMQERVPVLFAEAAARLEADPIYVLERQSTDPADALRCYPRRPDDGRIDWIRPAAEILRLINASSEPYAGAYSGLAGKRLTIWRARLPVDHEPYCAVPGQVAAVDRESGEVAVTTGRGKLVLTDVSCGGRRAVPATFIGSIRTRLT